MNSPRLERVTKTSRFNVLSTVSLSHLGISESANNGYEDIVSVRKNFPQMDI